MGNLPGSLVHTFLFGISVRADVDANAPSHEPVSAVSTKDREPGNRFTVQKFVR
jgi:hypothetical protein